MNDLRIRQLEERVAKLTADVAYAWKCYYELDKERWDQVNRKFYLEQQIVKHFSEVMPDVRADEWPVKMPRWNEPISIT